jgi:hypothetical protein
MGKSVFLAFILMLLGSVAFAGHAISLEPEAAPAAAEPAAEAPKAPAQQTAAPEVAPETKVAPEAAPAPQQPSKVAVTLPSELDLYVVPAATREVCKTIAWGYDEIRTDCRTEPIPVRQADPALRGLCVTRYGNRVCY